MHANSASRFFFTVVCASLLLWPLAGCKQESNPTYTSPDAIDQFLEANPEEAYSSDATSEDMTKAESNNEG